MTKQEKSLEKWRNNPRGVRFEEIDILLQRYGYTPRRSGGSHVVYSRPDSYPITVAYRSKFIHFKTVLAVLDAIDELAE